jgi:GMP synthase (glutamine-hydrolysing)
MIAMIALCLRHVEYQALGELEGPLRNAGLEISYIDVMKGELRLADIMAATVVVILGGPFDVDDLRNQPLQDEIALTGRRLTQKLPTFGICLGSQVIASALGATVGRMPSVEIGWRPVQLTSDGLTGPLRHLNGLDFLHWHACEASLPVGATRLASTAACSNQAFQLGRNVLALQFHAEVSPVIGRC